MSLSGEYELGPGDGSLTVNTARAGLAARAGHDLTLDVTGWKATLTIDPDDASRNSLVATIDADSLEVRAGSGGVAPLTEDNKGEIKDNIAKKVLRTQHFGSIDFTSQSVTPAGESVLDVAGNLTLVGVTRPISFQIALQDGGLSAEVPINQPDYEIRPYTALMGALKVAPVVTVSAQARVG